MPIELPPEVDVDLDLVGERMALPAVIDWGGCGWADPARDFAGVPLRAVPAMLAGYAEVAPAAADGGFRARIVVRQLQLALYNLHRPPQPGLSWAERPATMIVDVLRFLADAPPDWRELRPPAGPAAARAWSD